MATTVTSMSPPDRAALIARYRRSRERSRALFDLLVDDAYYSRPIALRHPFVFYEGHIPAFSVNTLVKRALGQPGIEDALERLFARGIDPDGVCGPEPDALAAWPSRELVRSFAAEADRRVLDALERAEFDNAAGGATDRLEALFTILEHEAMHQETLCYLLHRLPFEKKRLPNGYRPAGDGAVPQSEWVGIARGRATLGVDHGTLPFGWDNEHPAHAVDVEQFSIERFDVTNAAFLEFVEAGGYDNERWWRPKDWSWRRSSNIRHPLFWESDGRDWYWRGMFGRLRLPLSWPVYVSFAEATAFSRWRQARLPSEAEFQRAAFGTPEAGERRYAWGEDDPCPAHGVFDFSSWDPHPVGSHPAGRSAWGVDDLVGNGWEWTGSIFAPFPGFRPMASYPEYSADFFDNDHFVIKGASPGTAQELLRPTFRNWFRPCYPYVYATFRCARER
ncbi:conserved hypothetical protein [Burkholderiales bacterium]|nr:conserved hypothetical protein [Burkholderiales bacterium]